MPEECPYCSAEIHTPKVAKMKSTKLSVPKIFSHSRKITTTAPSFDVNCISCNRKFILVKYNDLKWIVNEIKYDLNAIRCFAAYGIDHNALLSHITGIALRSKRSKMDICFKHLEQRVYVSCVKEQDGWHAVSVELISFD